MGFRILIISFRSRNNNNNNNAQRSLFYDFEGSYWSIHRDVLSSADIRFSNKAASPFKRKLFRSVYWILSGLCIFGVLKMEWREMGCFDSIKEHLRTGFSGRISHPTDCANRSSFFAVTSKCFICSNNPNKGTHTFSERDFGKIATENKHEWFSKMKPIKG